MAAHAKYPAVHQQLLELARRAKAEGVPFADFWREAVRPEEPPVTWATPEDRRPIGAVVWPRDTTDRNVSLAATLGAKDGWRRAYDDLPPPPKERALQQLQPGLEALAEVARDRTAAELTAAA